MERNKWRWCHECCLVYSEDDAIMVAQDWAGGEERLSCPCCNDDWELGGWPLERYDWPEELKLAHFLPESGEGYYKCRRPDCICKK